MSLYKGCSIIMLFVVFRDGGCWLDVNYLVAAADHRHAHLAVDLVSRYFVALVPLFSVLHDLIFAV